MNPKSKDEQLQPLKAKLVFPSTADLWEFVQVAALETVEINIEKRSVTCSCSMDTVRMAMKKYGAKITKKDAL